jgi:hypothetical protein
LGAVLTRKSTDLFSQLRKKFLTNVFQILGKSCFGNKEIGFHSDKGITEIRGISFFCGYQNIHIILLARASVLDKILDLSRILSLKISSVNLTRQFFFNIFFLSSKFLFESSELLSVSVKFQIKLIILSYSSSGQ